MASDMSVYLGNKVCRWLAGNAMPAAPAACYVALFNGNPKASGVEVTDTINAGGRVAIAYDAIADDGVDNEITKSADGWAAGDGAVRFLTQDDGAAFMVGRGADGAHGVTRPTFLSLIHI